MKLHLFRHAESEANAGYKTSDPASIALTKKGQQEAIHIARTIEFLPDLIVITPYLRTHQTALPLIQKFPVAPVHTMELQEFTFLSPITCYHTTAKERLPLVQDYWNRCDPDYVHGPGAESFSNFVKRVSTSLNWLRAQPHENVVAFTHGQVMRLIRQYIEFGDQPVQVMMKQFRDTINDRAIGNGQRLTFTV